MSVPARALSCFVLAGMLVLGIASHAQIGGLSKPKVPGLPASADPKPTAPPKMKYCAAITEEQLDRFLKGLEVEHATRSREVAAGNAKKAEEDAAATRRGQQALDALMKLADCKDAAMAKDSRTKERDRLYQLAEEAAAKGDEKASEKYSNQASALSDRIDADAAKACGAGDGSTIEECRRAAIAKDPRTKERERMNGLAAEAARKGDKQLSDTYAAQASALAVLIEADAAGGCVTQRAIGYAPGDADNAASSEASEMLRHAYDKGEDAGAKTAGMTKEDYARLKECTLGRLRTPKTTPTTPESDKAIDARRPALEKALAALEGAR